MISIQNFVFNPFSENTYVLSDESKECAIIDPGCSDASERTTLLNYIKEKELKPVVLLNTHCHIDHVLGNNLISSTFDLPVTLCKKDLETYKAVVAYAPSYGFPDYKEVEELSFIDEGDIVSFGNSELETLFVPGHSAGHVAFVQKEERICFSGDVLFNSSIGRTDLPGGDFETLIQSIHQKLFTLDDNMTVYSGHGETTTIGKEKSTNPFCALV